MLYLGIFGLDFEKVIAIFEISVLEFILLQSLVQKQTSLNLRPKMLYLGIFGLKFENNIVKESAPSNLSDCKILRKKNV